jgi:RNA polymerase sigma-70 factor (ECF subfamily)
MAETSDDGLIKEILAGSSDAFDELMLRYQRLVCKVAMNYVKDRQSGLDVTQNVFLKVYTNLERVQREGMFKPWLLRITYNESINWLRKRKPNTDFELIDEFDPSLHTAPIQEDGVLKHENQKQVAQGISKLNPKYKLAVSLRYSEGMRIREIASVMDCTEGMVKSLLFRGVRQIRNHVANLA